MKETITGKISMMTQETIRFMICFTIMAQALADRFALLLLTPECLFKYKKTEKALSAFSQIKTVPSLLICYSYNDR